MRASRGVAFAGLTVLSRPVLLVLLFMKKRFGYFHYNSQSERSKKKVYSNSKRTDFVSITEVMLFWVLLSAAVSVDLTLAVYETVCYGADFAIKNINQFSSAVVTFKPARRSHRVLFQNGTIQDPRYQWKDGRLVVPEVTESDAGNYVITRRRGSTMGLIILKIDEDCHPTSYKDYGDDLRLGLSENAAALYFSLQDSPSHSNLLWNKTDPGTSRGGRGRVRGRSWLLDKVIHSDQGYYTQRTREGRFITRNLVFVNVKRGNHFLSSGDHLTLALQIPRSQVQVYFTPNEGLGRRQLVRDGRVLDSPDPDSTLGRVSVEEDSVQISDVRSYDSGQYEMEDHEGKLVYSAEVEVEEEERPAYLKYLPYLGLVIAAVLLCVCVKKICCKRKPAQAAVPVIYGEDSSPTYRLAPSVPSQPQWGETPGPSTPGYTSLMGNVSRPTPATEGGSSIPSYPPIQEVGGKKNTLSSDCLHSSDSGIQFEFGKGGKNKDYFSALPLNSDAPETSNVYTSDKLNFL